MKQFNKGDLVTSTNNYADVFEKECIYLGTTSGSNGRKYHVVGTTENENIGKYFVEDEYIKLIATAKYIPIPKFKRGDIVFNKEKELIILEERTENLTYLCYYGTKGYVENYLETDLSTEKEEKKLTLDEFLNTEEGDRCWDSQELKLILNDEVVFHLKINHEIELDKINLISESNQFTKNIKNYGVDKWEKKEDSYYIYIYELTKK
jgi:hypothetical protein